ncbi:hypothetical protein FB45DRAFT_1108408 [Roridomyces roridus]|uniref:Uncharacterized protein n=1 Tax=Roridomyces roridus TaxID=1738132 RepID=A0AAD7BAY8_9AGAR|nr:hypothetical protein FB45DRAFT_1108408 [Roridomyces roridus]
MPRAANTSTAKGKRRELSGPARTRHRKRRTQQNENNNSDGNNQDDSQQGQQTGGGENSAPEIREGMTQAELYLAGRRLQALVTEGRQSQREQDREPLADVTNEADQEDPDEAAAEDAKALAVVVHAGKKLVCTRLLWLPVGYEDAIFNSKEDPQYNPLQRFGDPKPTNRIQGAFRDVLDVLPVDYHASEDLSDWVGTTIEKAMADQRSATRNRLRGHPGLIGCSDADFATPAKRDEKFYTLIGGQYDDEGNRTHYSTSDAPVLYSDYDEDDEGIDVDKIFFADKLLWIHSAITLGPGVTKLIQNGQPVPPGTSNAKIWKLRKTTPGMIAGAAVWLRWVLSPDQEFTAIGDHTNINWEADFEAYLEYLTEGLDDGNDAIVALFKKWDEHFYPLSEESTAEGEIPEVQESRNALMEALRRSK